MAVALATLVGCATNDTAREAPKPKDGIAEYREIVREALAAIATALSSLDRVRAQTDRCSPRIVRAFSKEVQTLQAESIKVRARNQAMQARGDAYFAHWEENLARVKDPRVRELAQRHHLQLLQSFARIKQTSQQTGDAFRPFLSGLRKLQLTLENDSGCLGTDATRELVRSTRQKGRQVQAGLVAIRQELDAMTGLLTPVKPAAQH